MDARRLLMLVAACAALCGCAELRRGTVLPTAPATLAVRTWPVRAAIPPPTIMRVAAMAPIPNPPSPASPPRRTAGHRRHAETTPRVASGRAAIALANAHARARSRGDGFEGGVQVFAYEPGKVYEVWTAPFRVTTITLAPGETTVAKAAGDTVRWQIGETTSGAGAGQRTHVLVKPLQRGLETNLVLATNLRLYMLELKSGSPEAFNAAVTWHAAPAPPSPAVTETETRSAVPVAAPIGPVDARYRIFAKGRAPRWTPTAVMNDGAHTFITFPPDLAVQDAPALFVIAPNGQAQMANYRQQRGVFVVDEVFDRAELRLGQTHPQVVRIERLGGPS